MSESILTSTKKVLGVAEDYTEFDLDITTHINATLSTASQFGVGLEDFFVVDASETWADLQLPKHIENMLRSYVYLKVRFLFDPPATSFLLEAHAKQIAEFESRMSTARELIAHPYVPPVEEEVV